MTVFPIVNTKPVLPCSKIRSCSTINSTSAKQLNFIRWGAPGRISGSCGSSAMGTPNWPQSFWTTFGCSTMATPLSCVLKGYTIVTQKVSADPSPRPKVPLMAGRTKSRRFIGVGNKTRSITSTTALFRVLGSLSSRAWSSGTTKIGLRRATIGRL